MLPPVVLLHDAFAAHGRVDASDVLLEAEHLAGALGELGVRASILPVSLDLAKLERSLSELMPRAVFNLVESLGGRGQLIHVVPALLESLRLPFTGCSASAQCLTSNKLLAKRQLLRAGIPTPALFDSGRDAGPWIVKSVWEHASLGLDDASVLDTRVAVEDVIGQRSARYGGQWFAEAFVPGRELNVAVIASDRGPLVLPVAEICFRDFPPGKPQIVGYAAKWHSDSFEYRNTARTFMVDASDSSLAVRAQELAVACWDLFALDGYARIDLRVDENGTPWVLEVNANPCLSPDAGFAAALAQAGIGFNTAVTWLIDDAVRRVAGHGSHGVRSG
ncbi:MAG TPA: D-alanine--D-alanine ligase [Gammaproteobacteria bacterium]|nr:D-alanine--D-alanine ligase [Gammaproteobacteria bacterium]